MLGRGRKRPLQTFLLGSPVIPECVFLQCHGMGRRMRKEKKEIGKDFQGFFVVVVVVQTTRVLVR